MKYLNEVSTPELIKLIKQNLSTKQDLITSPVNNNLAGMDSTGQTIDSGISTDTIKDNIYDTKSYTDQSFLYRESLAEEDCVGKLDTIKGNSLVFNQKVWNEANANILKIKGNTVKFNQLVQNGNFADTSNWTPTTCNFSVSNNICSITATAKWGRITNAIPVLNGHKYYWCAEAKGTTENFVEFVIAMYLTKTNEWEKISNIWVSGVNGNKNFVCGDRTTDGWTTFQIKNAMVFDLTAMGIDNLTTVEQVETWLSTHVGLQDYYSYTPGKLISFGDYGKVNFNQLVQNGNFINTDNWVENQGTVSVDNNVLTLTITSQTWSQNIAQPNKNVIANHKYLMAFDIQTSVISHGVMGRLYSSSADTRMTMKTVSANTKTRIAEIITPTQSYTANMILYCCFQNSTESNGLPVGATVRFSNAILIDLSQMFGAGNEPTIEEFEQLYPNAYYDFTTGREEVIDRLAIKTTGKNLLNMNIPADITIAGIRYIRNSDGTISVSGTATGTSTYTIFTGKNVSKFSGLYLQGNPITDSSVAILGIQEQGGTWKSYGYDYGSGVKIGDISNDTNIWIFIRIFTGKTVNAIFKPMICFNNNETYEPYQESTTHLPVYNLFPTGMKNVPNTDVYDELTENKATTRLNKVVFNGSESWAQGNPSQRFYLEGVITDFKNGSVGVATNGWEVVTNDVYATDGNNKIWFQAFGSTYRLNAYANTLGLSNAQEFKEYLASNPLTVVYELATPTSQDISLDLTYPVYNNGTEQILPINGSTPVTAPLKATIDYPDGVEEAEFLYKQTLRNIVLTNGHSYITRINGTWSNVSGTGQTLTVSDDDMVIDLTQMACSYITNYTQFLQYYPNDYEFEKGRLISFNGTGLKTTGVNLFNKTEYQNLISTYDYYLQGYNCKTIQLKPYTTYTVSFVAESSAVQPILLIHNISKVNDTGFLDCRQSSGSKTFTTDSSGCLYIGAVANNMTDEIVNARIDAINLQIQIGETSTEYEPYTESILSLKALNALFPTGMKSAGSVYDEATSNRADTRIGEVDLGTLNWAYRTTGSALAPYFYVLFTGIKSNGDPTRYKANVLCSKYPTVVRNATSFIDKTMCIDGDITTLSQIQIKDSSYTDATSFKQAMSGVMLYYELATPTTTSITTDLLFDAYKGGTEEILSTSTTTPATSPIVTDMSYLGTKDTIDLSYDLLKEAKEEIGVLELNSIYYGNETAI